MVDVQSSDGENVLRSLVEASLLGTLVVNREGVVALVNAAAQKIFGYSEEEIRGHRLDHLIPGGSRKVHRKHISRFFAAPSARLMADKRVVYARHRSGRKFPIEVKLSPISINGNVYAIAIVSDITFQKKITDRNKLLFQAFQETVNGIYVIDVRTLTFTEVNRGGLNQLGYSLKEMQQFQPWDVQFSRDEQHFRELAASLEKSTHRKLTYETILKRKDGSYFSADVHLQRFLYDSEDVYILFAIDISERKQAEEALVLQSEITRNLAEGVILLNADDARILYTNAQFDSMFGYAQHALFGRDFFTFCDHDEAPAHQIKEEIARVLEAGEKWTHEFNFPRKQQEQGFWCRVSFTSFEHPAHGSVWLGVFSDIDESKQIEQALAREEEKARMYLDIAAAMIVVIDKDGKVSLINQQGCKLLGYREDEILGRDWFTHFLPKGVREEVANIFTEAMREKLDKLEYYENPVLTRDGQERLIEWHNVLLRDEAGQVVASLSSGIDITEKRKAELEKTWALIEGQETERKRIAEELHDGLSQSLTAIRLHLGALESELDKDRLRKKEKLKVLKKMLEEVTQEVKEISHALKPRVLEEHGLVKSLELLVKTLNESSDLEVHLNIYHLSKEPEYSVSLCIYRVIQELINNALRHAKASRVDIQLVQYDDRIALTVEDDGSGFDTSITQTNGRGLGLRNIKTRVAALAGRLEIESDVGKGTLAIVEIPLNQ